MREQSLPRDAPEESRPSLSRERHRGARENGTYVVRLKIQIRNTLAPIWPRPSLPRPARGLGKFGQALSRGEILGCAVVSTVSSNV